MKCLVRHITRKSRGGIAVRDEILQTDTITIGRGSDCDIQLSDPRLLLHQAKITKSGRTTFLSPLHGGEIEINDTVTKGASIGVEDTFNIGPYQFGVDPSADDYDVILTVELKSRISDELEHLVKNSNTEFTLPYFPKRAWSWGLAIAIICVALIIPLLETTSTPPVPGAALQGINVDSADSGILGYWSSGAISASHKFFGESCDVCHVTPFVRVQNETCLGCHAGIQQHASPTLFKFASLDDDLCQSCHKEHQGDLPIVREDEEFCLDCHINLTSQAQNTTLRIVSDFHAGHPQFRPTVIQDSTRQIFSRDHNLTEMPFPTESSGLKFPHDSHMRDTGVQHPLRGNINLTCENCHQADEGSKSMLPITFEKHCHDCHVLKFDKHVPDRELIHANAEELYKQISDIYTAVAMRGGYEEADAPSVVRRRPGEPLSVKQKETATNWAESKTQEILNGRFGKGLCEECHSINDQLDSPTWVVQPVYVTGLWFPKAKFTHEPHTPIDCGLCHAAQSSLDASDVLMPSIEICQSCHGGETAQNRVPTTCIKCHDFHVHTSPTIQEMKRVEHVDSPFANFANLNKSLNYKGSR